MTSKSKNTLKNISAGILATTLAVTALSVSPTPTNILAFTQANAKAVHVQAVQAPGFADVVEAVSPAVVSVRVEQTLNASNDRGNFRFDRRDRSDQESRRDDRQGRLPKFFRNHPDFKDFFEDRKRRNDRSDGSDSNERDDDRRFSQRDDDRDDKRKKRRKLRRGMSQGSGFFVSDDGYIVTNNHVVENGSKFTIVMHDGKEHEARLIGADKRSDLAVLKIDDVADKFTYVSFGEKDPRIGDWVVAVGNPFGLGGTVTSGIVSARGREIGANRYDDFIQIDAAVNKGNSGGPAFNLNGEVIGVNTAIFSPSGGNVGIAFAIPADTAQEIVTDLIENGKVVRGWLGVQIQPITTDIAESLGLDEALGAIVTKPQTGSPADKAGIKAGDVILSVDGKSVKDPRELARVIAGYDPKSSVAISIWRDGAKQELTVNLGVLSNPNSAKGKLKNKRNKVRVGLSLETAPNGGVVVVEVEPDSPAEEKNILKGDVVKTVNGEEVNEPSDVSKIVGQAAKLGRKAALFQIERNGQSSFVAIPLKKG